MPKIPSLLKEIMIMGGIFTNRAAGFSPLEWNIICDPYAAAIVYRAPVKIHQSVGLDVTTRVTLDKAEVRRRFSTIGILKPVYDFAQIWFEQVELLTFHDPLAAAALFEPDICRFSRGNVQIELASTKLLGMTHWQGDEESGEHLAALDVDRERFINHYFDIVAKGG